MNTQSIALDLDKIVNVEQFVTVGRGDHNGTIIAARILDAGSSVDLNGTTVTLNVRLSGGESLSIGGFVSGSVATFELDESLITSSVKFAYVSIDDGSSRYSTERFDIIVLDGSSE